MAIGNATNPAPYLSAYPCTNSQCLSPHEQLVTLVYLYNSLTVGLTVSQLEQAVKKYRNLSNAEFMQILIATFPANTLNNLDGEDLKCLTCYSDRKLLEMLVYLISQGITDLSNI